MPRLTHLQRLEAESIDIMREAVSESENPVMLYSIGKDSGVLAHLARKAFHPGRVPFPLLHVDTTWKFRAMYEFRERFCRENGLELRVHVNEEARAKGVNPFDYGSNVYTTIMKTHALIQALEVREGRRLAEAPRQPEMELPEIALVGHDRRWCESALMRQVI